MRNKTKTRFPQPHCFFPDSTSLSNLPPPPSITRDGEWGLWLVPSHVSTASSSSLFCSSMGSHPRDTILHKPLQCGFFPRAEVLQEWSALVWVLPENLLLKGSSPWATAPEGSSFLQSTCEMLQGLQGGYLLHHCPSWASRGESASQESPAQAAGSALYLEPLLAFLPLASISAELFLPPVPHTLSQAHSEVLPEWMSDSAWAVQYQPWSCLKWALSNMGQLPVSSPRSHPYSSLLQNPAT